MAEFNIRFRDTPDGVEITTSPPMSEVQNSTRADIPQESRAIKLATQLLNLVGTVANMHAEEAVKS